MGKAQFIWLTWGVGSCWRQRRNLGTRASWGECSSSQKGPDHPAMFLPRFRGRFSVLFSSATCRTWRPTEDSCWEGCRSDAVCTGSIWEEAHDHKQEGVLQETGLQTRVGREGW